MSLAFFLLCLAVLVLSAPSLPSWFGRIAFALVVVAMIVAFVGWHGGLGWR